MNVIDKEKANTIEENVPKVYHSGRFNVIKDSTYLKGSESGQHICLDDVSDIEHTLGVKISSKNIIPYPYYDKSKTHNGITYTVNDDGSVTANGTATGGTSTFYFTVWSLADKIPHLFEDGETYTIQGKSGSARILLHYRDKETDADKYAQAGGSSATFKVDKTKYKYCHLRIQVDEGSTVDNATIYPTIIKSSIKDQSFTLNVPDLVNVNVKTSGKNFYKPKALANTSAYGVTAKLEADGGIKLKGTNTNSTNAALFVLDDKKLTLPKGTYTISLKGSSNTYALIFITDLSTGKQRYSQSNNGSTKTFTISDVDRIDNVQPRVKASATVDETVYIQIESGSTNTTYEPYIEPKVYVPNADGTVDSVTNISPVMNILTDTDGVVIDCDYYKDTDKAYSKLQQTLALSGGE